MHTVVSNDRCLCLGTLPQVLQGAGIIPAVVRPGGRQAGDLSARQPEAQGYRASTEGARGFPKRRVEAIGRIRKQPNARRHFPRRLRYRQGDRQERTGKHEAAMGPAE